MTTLLIGNETTNSAKRRQQDEYRQDLELQIREKDAARLRERFQGMSVNASGWLDPEKRPDRLKPLGGTGLLTDRTERKSKVRPYHTLFNYGKRAPGDVTPRAMEASSLPPTHREPNNLYLATVHLDSTAGLHHYPLTEATGGQLGQPHDSVNNAYNFYATRDLDRPAAGFGSFIQPLVIPYVDNRPIIMPAARDNYREPVTPRYNPFLNNGNTEVKPLLDLSQMEQARLRAQMAKDNEEFQRRLKKELEDERRKLLEQEAETRRKIEEMRREYEQRKRDYERQQRMTTKPKDEELPKSAPIVIRPPSTTLLSDMDETRKRLREERKAIEELLRRQKAQPEYPEVKVVKRPPPPPTPPDPDRPNKRIVEEFTLLKHKDADTRQAFRSRYPDIPETNTRLEHQQRALLRQQETNLNSFAKEKPKPMTTMGLRYERPAWMDKTPTPFPHRLRERDRLYLTSSMDVDLDRIYRRAERREQGLDKVHESLDDFDQYDKLRLRSYRPASTETLTDDTWLRPSSVAAA